MTTRPWLSVITPVLNGANYLSTALDSVVLQKDNEIECIAVDGESTDETVAILKSYQDRLPIRILYRERNSNWVSKTNHALSFATGEYVCFLHHDDLWFKDRLRIMKALAQQFPQVNLFLHPSSYVDDNGNNLGIWRCPLPQYPEIIKPSSLIEKLLIQNSISILGAIFKRETALRVGGLDESLWYTADWDFWLKIATCGDTLYYPNPLSGFRIHQHSQTIAGSSHVKDFRNQLESVANKHLILWTAPEQGKRRIRRTVNFSIEVNIALSRAVHAQKTNLFALFISFLLLGPSEWVRYLRDSRIWERVSARLKARLLTTGSK
jgi:glycosyltransferase involved in cell wall biosynthesis